MTQLQQDTLPAEAARLLTDAQMLSPSLGTPLHLAPQTGVTVTALAPGWVRTEFHERAAIRTSSIPGVLWLEADALVAECLDDVARGKVVSIPSKRYRALMWAVRHAPRQAVRAASRRLSSSRRTAAS